MASLACGLAYVKSSYPQAREALFVVVFISFSSTVLLVCCWGLVGSFLRMESSFLCVLRRDTYTIAIRADIQFCSQRIVALGFVSSFNV